MKRTCLLVLLALARFELSRALPASVRPGDRKIYVDGIPLHIKGVNWNPVPVGRTHPEGIQFAEHVQNDARLLAEAGVNVVRTYEPITDTVVLDALWNNSIQVMNTVYSNSDKAPESVVGEVELVKDHPAVLMWAVGNEWNYNGCYTGLDLHACGQRLNEVAKLIKQHDSLHPVASVYGEVPPFDVIQRLDSIDVWGINYYNMLSFGDLFQRWEARSTKPLFIGEYGADAYDASIGKENEEEQAKATTILTGQLIDNTAVWDNGICSGGFIFELADEWWKDGKGSVDKQDVGGIAPGGGPHPDRVFNEEWWGLMKIDRTPRKAYYAFASLPVPKPQMADVVMMQGGQAAEGMVKSCTAQGCTLVPLPRHELQPPRAAHPPAFTLPLPGV